METMEELLAIVADILKVGMRRIANVCPYLSKLEEWWDVELLFGLIDK